MRIVYPVSTFPSVTETFILDQITALIDLEHDVRIVAFHRPAEQVVHPQVQTYELLARTVYAGMSADGADFDFTPELSTLLRRADVIHAHFAALPTDFALAASRRFGVPFIFTTHAYDIFVHTTAERLAEYAAAASRIIADTEFNRRYILDMLGGQYGDKLDIIHTGIDVERYASVARPIRDTVTILTAGRFVEKKGIVYAIRAMSQLPKECKAVLRVVGYGPLAQDIAQVIDALHLHDRVSLLGALPRTELIKEMQAADIFLLPSVTAKNNDREGLPVAILEAQAMELPVVSTLHTGIPEGVVNGVTGILVPERDVAALSGALLRLIDDPELRRQMGNSGRWHVAEHFNIASEMAQLETVLQGTAGRRSEKAGTLVGSPLGRVKTGDVSHPRRTKVLVISHTSWFNGAEQSLLHYLQHMDRSRYEPVVVLPEVLPAGQNVLYHRLREAGIRTIYLPSPWWINVGDEDILLRDFLNELANAQLLAEVIRREQADLVYTNTMVRISGALAARLTGVPHIFHVREILKDHLMRPPVSVDAALRLVNALSDRIIANSKAVAQQFSGIAASGKVSAVYNAVDVSAFGGSAGCGKLRAEVGVSERTALVGIIGTVIATKGQEYLVRAFATIRRQGLDAQLVIIGYADGEYGSFVRALVEKFGIADAVHFLPFRTDIPDIMAELDVVVVASLAEPFGRTIIEAMAAGRPVVATDAGGVPEVVVDGVTGFLVPPHDSDAMANRIVALLTNPDLAGRMGNEGRRRVQAVFGTKSYIAGIETAFAEATCESNFSRGIPGHQLAQTVLQVLGPVAVQSLALRCAEKFDQLEQHIRPFFANAVDDVQRDHSQALADMQIKYEEIIARLEHDASCRTAQKDEEISCLAAEIHAIRDTFSWRVTAPLRKLKSILS